MPLLPLSAAVLLLSLLFPTAVADLPGDPSPHAPDAVAVTHHVHLRDQLDGFQVESAMDVFEIEVAPLGGRTASELRAAPVPVRSLFEADARARIQAEAMQNFPQAHVALERVTFEYGLDDGDANPYHPPVRILFRISILLTPAYLGLDPAAQADPGSVVHAFFQSGGIASFPQRQLIRPGWSIAATLDVPPTFEILMGDQPPAGLARFAVDNLAGDHATRLEERIRLRLRPDEVPAAVLAGPLVRATLRLDDATPAWKGAVPWAAAEFEGHLTLEFVIHSLDIGSLDHAILPAGMTTRLVSADLLRVAVQEDLVDPERLRQEFGRSMHAGLEQAFGPGIRAEIDWDAFDQGLDQPIARPDDPREVQPLRIHATAHVRLPEGTLLPDHGFARLASMTGGHAGSVLLRNPGSWAADYTVLYPEGSSIRIREPAGAAQPTESQGRQGVTVHLQPGETVILKVGGRLAPDLFYLSSSLAYLALLATAVTVACRRIRRRFHVTSATNDDG